MASKPHSPRSPLASDRWTPQDIPRERIRQALLGGGMAGVVSHDRQNVVWKLQLLADGDERSQFGITGVDQPTFEDVLRLMAEWGGIDPDPLVKHGVTRVDPDRVIERCEAVGDRLARAAERGERLLLATGHPNGLPLLYAAVGRLVTERGGSVITPAKGAEIVHRGLRRWIRYEDAVGMLSNGRKGIHTHSPDAMRAMLAEDVPDLVFADHGFAGGAIEAGVDTVSIADVNDPALVVAESMGRTGPVIVMDDNVEPQDYWPCFQVIASRFPRM